MAADLDRYEAYYAEKLWQLIPAIYRSVDSDSFDSKGPLREIVDREAPDVEFFTTYIGAGTPIFYLSIPAELPDPGFAQFVIKTAGSYVEVEAMLLRIQQRLLPGNPRRAATWPTENERSKQNLDFGDQYGSFVQSVLNSAAQRELNLKVPLPSDAEIDRVMSAFEKMWRRIVDMVQKTPGSDKI